MTLEPCNDKSHAVTIYNDGRKAGVVAEREHVRYISAQWLRELSWCIEQMDMDSAYNGETFTMERDLFREVRQRLSNVHSSIWEETEEADDDPR